MVFNHRILRCLITDLLWPPVLLSERKQRSYLLAISFEVGNVLLLSCLDANVTFFRNVTILGSCACYLIESSRLCAVGGYGLVNVTFARNVTI